MVIKTYSKKIANTYNAIDAIKGIFDAVAANNFLTYILQPGGSEDPATLYQQYRGREARIESLLEQSGIYWRQHE